jgi:hypothetical protein
MYDRMFEYSCRDEKDPGGRECNGCANEMLGLQGRVKIMAIPYKKDKALLTNQCLGKESIKC